MFHEALIEMAIIGCVIGEGRLVGVAVRGRRLLATAIRRRKGNAAAVVAHLDAGRPKPL
jgi:hypothetical protein